MIDLVGVAHEVDILEVPNRLVASHNMWTCDLVSGITLCKI